MSVEDMLKMDKIHEYLSTRSVKELKDLIDWCHQRIDTIGKDIVVLLQQGHKVTVRNIKNDRDWKGIVVAVNEAKGKVRVEHEDTGYVAWFKGDRIVSKPPSIKP